MRESGIRIEAREHELELELARVGADVAVVGGVAEAVAADVQGDGEPAAPADGEGEGGQVGGFAGAQRAGGRDAPRGRLAPHVGRRRDGLGVDAAPVRLGLRVRRRGEGVSCTLHRMGWFGWRARRAGLLRSHRRRHGLSSAR